MGRNNRDKDCKNVIHFLTDVFAAIASSDCKVPITLSVCFGKTRGCCWCTQKVSCWLEQVHVQGFTCESMRYCSLHSFLSNQFEQKFPFHLRNSFSAGVWRWSFSRHFQCLPVNEVHGQSQFFLFIQNGICMSDARTLGGFSRETSCLLVVKTKERIS